MTIKLKHPLRLADNISAFDPQEPLTLLPDMSSVIAIPIADKSAVAGERVAKARLVSGIPGRRHLPLFNVDTNVEHLSYVFTSAGDRFYATFSQEVFAVWWTFVATPPGNYCSYDVPQHDTNIAYALLDGGGRLLRQRKTALAFTGQGAIPIGTAYVTGFF